ncbi:hypothetical protein GRS48_12605 [Halorubrum sp. JWXQ-INN 858]|uniref:hypothetical protein n=1 Tax=Halorubrum sp. JWXQ-INN 858 TaxID=2690782 RepID=UPI001357048D|nr:hypothetical protein [Halorubrum sp. JWXQ-INN 858]MWV65653.1 hypothetical protein [Halorubrum sp. JWXQ-INN 858]
MSIVDAITAEPLLSLATGIFVTILGGIGLYEYRRSRESTDDAKEWYRDSLALIGQLQNIGHQTTGIQQHDTETLREKLDPLTDNLRSHAEKAPDKIPFEARKDLAVLSAFATGLINITEQHDNLGPLEILDNLQEHVKENHDRDYDIDDVNDFIEDIELDGLADQMAERGEEDFELDDKVVEEITDNISDESLETGQIASIEDATNIPFDRFQEAIDDDEFIDDLMDDTMRTYSQFILLQVSSDVYRKMELRLQRE